MNVGIIGSCLSNLPAAFLMSDYGWTRLNNAAANRSDLFISQVVEGNDPPPLAELQALFGIDSSQPDINRYLIENYRHLSGMTEIDPALPSLWENLHSQTFDAILLDNLADIAHGKLRYKGEHFAPFDLSFHIHLGSRAEIAQPQFDVLPPMSATESADSWTVIVKFLKALQPNARLFFSSAPYCTAIGDQYRYERAMGFHNAFVERTEGLGVEILPPAVLPISMTKLPQDRDHFDMSVYRAIAGHIHMSTLGGWSNWRNTLLPPEVINAPVDHSITPGQPEARTETHSPARLRSVVASALGIAEDRVGEDAAMGRTERWDSLKQIGVVLAVEEAFGVSLPFKATTDAINIPTLRSALLGKGVIAADHVDARAVAETVADAAEGRRETLGDERHAAAPVDWASADPDRNLFADFARRGLDYPESPYALFVSGETARRLNNGEVLAGAVDLAQRLSHLERGTTVAIVLDHSPELYSTFIGCVLAGLSPTILAPKTPRQDPAVFHKSMQVLFSRVRPSAVVTSAEAGDAVPEGDFQTVSANTLGVADLDAVRAFVDNLPSSGFGAATAFLQHSSGTTGHKKGVLLSHGQTLEQARLYANAIGMNAGDRVASWLPLYHDMGLITSFVIPTVVGCPIVSMDAQEWVLRPTTLLDFIETERADYCWLPNFAFLHIARNDRGTRTFDLRSMKMFVNCSEPCRTDSFDLFHERYADAGVTPEMLQVSYAMAENVFAVTQTTPGRPTRRSEISAGSYLSCGRPLPGVEIEIRDADGNAVKAGVEGEICLRSTSMFSGYYRLPEVTAERVVEGWYVTQDLGRMEDGELFVIGRTDDLVIVNGKNIIAHEVEDQIGGIEGIAAGRILTAGVFNDSTGTSELIILAETREGSGVSGTDIEARVRDIVFASTGVSPAMVQLLPRGYLVKSSSGKLARHASLKKFREIGLDHQAFA
ncbi:hypothetical protein BH09PSE1_BH09PSE1_07330 [soil metagenome]